MPDSPVSRSVASPPSYTIRRAGMLNGGQKDGPITVGVRLVEDIDVRRAMLHWLPWRAEGCVILACIDPEDIEGINDERIGEMAAPKLAEDAATAHNVALREVQ